MGSFPCIWVSSRSELRLWPSQIDDDSDFDSGRRGWVAFVCEASQAGSVEGFGGMYRERELKMDVWSRCVEERKGVSGSGVEVGVVREKELWGVGEGVGDGRVVTGGIWGRKMF
ncbi:ankyrin repeat-containing protein [Pyrus ussuriensis x Pyrus communis]|uniref:Ankyrin repeat-containing protein n=1 Tax=Pyrus ussuriensis x Pyrus communis TaxID=2448454 RepID=A0A5N5HX52_9ROSA|nr:ankyrin repeat-containing protein [Pyrus ussuriensis x Pyrus communis]